MMMPKSSDDLAVIAPNQSNNHDSERNRPSIMDLARKKKTLKDSRPNSPKIKATMSIGRSKNSSFNSCLEAIYEIGDTIGQGAFSRVVTVTEKRNQKRTLACKILDLPPAGHAPSAGQTTISQAETELEVIRSFEHPNLLQLHDWHFDHEKAKCYLITGLSRGGTLKVALDDRGSFTEDDTKTIMRGVLGGLAHMHARGIGHRDLKPDNILVVDELESTNVQLADFGMAKKLDPNSVHTVCGTPMYIAPEIISRLPAIIHNEEGAYSGYDTKADIWSCGVILFQLLSGSPPFLSTSVSKLFSQIRSGLYNFKDPAWEFISVRAKDLVEDMMEVDPRKRLTAEEALNHPWLRDE